MASQSKLKAIRRTSNVGRNHGGVDCEIPRSKPKCSSCSCRGKFHTEAGLGTAASILQRNPELKVVVVNPTSEISTNSPDYQLEVLEPPVRFVQDVNRMAAYKHLSTRNDDLQCK